MTIWYDIYNDRILIKQFDKNFFGEYFETAEGRYILPSDKYKREFLQYIGRFS